MASLQADDRTVYRRHGDEYVVYHDPGPPPLMGVEGDALYRAGIDHEFLPLSTPSPRVADPEVEARRTELVLRFFQKHLQKTE